MTDSQEPGQVPDEVKVRYANALGMPNPTGGVVSVEPHSKTNRFDSPPAQNDVEGHRKRDEVNRAQAERCLAMQREYEAEVAKTEERLRRLYPEDIAQLGPEDRVRYGLDSEIPQIQADGRDIYNRARATQLNYLTSQRGLARQYGEFAQRYTQNALRNEISWNRKWDE